MEEIQEITLFDLKKHYIDVGDKDKLNELCSFYPSLNKEIDPLFFEDLTPQQTNYVLSVGTYLPQSQFVLHAVKMGIKEQKINYFIQKYLKK